MRGIAALTVAALLVVACGNGDTSSADQLVGDWVTDLGGIHAVFTETGTYGKGHTLELATPRSDATAELEWGTWSMSADILTLSPDSESQFCRESIGRYEIGFLDGGDRLDVTVIEDDCSPRNSDFGGGLTRTRTDNT